MSESAAAAHAEDEAFDRPYDLRLMRRLLSCLRPYRLGVAAAVLVLLAAAAMETVGPFLTQRALDVAVPRRDPGTWGCWSRSTWPRWWARSSSSTWRRCSPPGWRST